MTTGRKSAKLPSTYSLGSWASWFPSECAACEAEPTPAAHVQFSILLSRYIAWLKAKGLPTPEVSLRHFSHVGSRNFRARLRMAARTPEQVVQWGSRVPGNVGLHQGVAPKHSRSKSTAPARVAAAPKVHHVASHSSGGGGSSGRAATAAMFQLPGARTRGVTFASRRPGAGMASSPPASPPHGAASAGQGILRGDDPGTGGGLGSSGGLHGMLHLFRDIVRAESASPLAAQARPSTTTGKQAVGVKSGGEVRRASLA